MTKNGKKKRLEEWNKQQSNTSWAGRVAVVLTIVGDDLEGKRGQEKEQEERQNHCRRRKSMEEASTNRKKYLPCDNQPICEGNRASVRWV